MPWPGSSTRTPHRSLCRCLRRSRRGVATKSSPPIRALAGGERGFILPLAFAGSLLLLLGSLSLQGLALEARLAQRQREVRDLEEDALISGAQQLVATLNRSHPCLLTLPLERWSRDGGSCASGGSQPIVRGGPEETRWHLIDWRPGSERADLWIELQGQASGTPRRRGRFSVILLSAPPRALPPRLLALQGVAP